MTTRLLISSVPGETRAAWQRDDRLEDLVVLRDDKPSRLGNLYLGRIARLDRSLEAAFVEIGLERQAFLPRPEWIDTQLSEGDAVLVRVVREASGDKGVRVTMRGQEGAEDLRALADRAEPPALLRAADDPVARVLAARHPPDEIVVEGAAALGALRARLVDAGSELAARVRPHRAPTPLFEEAGIEAEIEALLEPRVALPSGGVLLIEPVTGMVAVDVDSGRYRSPGGAEAAARAVNLEAAEVLGRQLRLRSLSGLIVIDFLAMKGRDSRQEVVARLRAGVKRDREPCRVYPMSPSGLVEMTRRRGRPALHETLTEAVGIGGSGRVKSAETLAFEALRRLSRDAVHKPGGAPALRAPAAVIAALRGPAEAALRDLEQRLGRPVELLTGDGAEADGVEAVVERRV